MSTRLEQVMADLRAAGKKGIFIYITAGAPNAEASIEAIRQGQRNIMVGVRNNEIVYVPFSECIRTDKPFDKKLIKVLDELSI